MSENPLRTRDGYERFLYTLPARYPGIRCSTLVYIPFGAYFGRVEGFLLFDHCLVLCILEHLTFLPYGRIEHYGYEVSRCGLTSDQLLALPAAEYCTATYPHKEKLCWYDSFSHPTTRRWLPPIRITDTFPPISNITVSLPPSFPSPDPTCPS